jgi:hypothetical protein
MTSGEGPYLVTVRRGEVVGERAAFECRWPAIEHACAHINAMPRDYLDHMADLAAISSAYDHVRILLPEEGGVVELPREETIAVELMVECDERCNHAGPFVWRTTEGWQVLECEGVARELIYEHGVRMFGRAAEHAAAQEPQEPQR